MTTTRSVALPLVRVQRGATENKLARVLAWGDRVEFVERTSTNLVIETTAHVEQLDGSVFLSSSRATSAIGARRPRRSSGQATTTCLPSTSLTSSRAMLPSSRRQRARSCSSTAAKTSCSRGTSPNRFWGTTATAPREIDTIVVSHGDADHFVGLRKIYDSEHEKRVKKRLFIDPRRVYHNGLTKGPSSLKDVDMFGPHEPVDGREYIIDLVDDLQDAAAEPAQPAVQGVDPGADRLRTACPGGRPAVHRRASRAWKRRQVPLIRRREHHRRCPGSDHEDRADAGRPGNPRCRS